MTRVVRHVVASMLAATALGCCSFVVNYSVKEKAGEYQTLALIHDTLAQLPDAAQHNTPHTLAVLAGMAKKESRFWAAAKGRDNEAGTMQLSVPVARMYGLRVPEQSTQSTAIEKLLAAPPTPQAIAADERLDTQKSIRAGTQYFLTLDERLAAKYRLPEQPAAEFAVIAYNIGIGNAERLLDRGWTKDPAAFAQRLEHATTAETGIARRKLIVTSQYFQSVLEYATEYDKNATQMLARGKPTLGEFLQHTVIATPKELYMRLRY